MSSLGWFAFLSIIMPHSFLECRAASDTLPVTTIIAVPSPEPVKINLLEDEVILPPYLVRFEGGPVLNVTPAIKPPRTVNAKELMDYGDSFRLLPKLSFQVVGKENFQWVGGGVFEGRFFGPLVSKTEIPYGFKLDRGWARVWVNEPEPGVRIATPNGEFVTQAAQFWMSVQNGETEVYLLSGAMKGPDGLEIALDRFLKWKPGSNAPASSRHWSRVDLETKIKAIYPGLLELARKADDDWKDGLPQKVYSELRKNGWRKASRTAPKVP